MLVQQGVIALSVIMFVHFVHTKMSSLSELGIHAALQHILRMNLYISQKQVWKAMKSKPFLSKIIKHNHSSSCREGPWCHSKAHDVTCLFQ